MGLYKNILARFPRGNLSYVFAYGSGVKKQLGYDDQITNQSNNVIDFLFCVNDPFGWHAENMYRHKEHYSALRRFGPEFITKYQENFGACVYFNTLVTLPDINVSIKYGVISRENLLRDLKEWSHLYVAGRLQKPVHDVVAPTEDIQLQKALIYNLKSAFHVALLLLPEKFTAFELFHTIGSLSYKGDFRMIIGENKNKVRNIVRAQQEDFLLLYQPALRDLSSYVAVNLLSNISDDLYNIKNSWYHSFEQDKSSNANEYHLRHIPRELQRRLLHNAPFKGSYPDIVVNLSKYNNLHKIVQASVNDIVWRSSITQSLKNIPSAGLLKSLTYSYRKILKTFIK